MKSLTIEQFKDLQIFLFEYHSFYYSKKTKGNPHRKGHKYIESIMDSRDGDIWLVRLRGGFAPDITFRSNYINALSSDSKRKKINFASLYEWIMAYLNDEWKPDKEYYQSEGKIYEEHETNKNTRTAQNNDKLKENDLKYTENGTFHMVYHCLGFFAHKHGITMSGKDLEDWIEENKDKYLPNVIN